MPAVSEGSYGISRRSARTELSAIGRARVGAIQAACEGQTDALQRRLVTVK